MITRYCDECYKEIKENNWYECKNCDAVYHIGCEPSNGKCKYCGKDVKKA